MPEVKPGWVLIEVKAFGLNRSEMYTRQGHSGDAVKFPRVLGIECVGQVVDPSDSDFRPNQKVAAVMGGMGRVFDGSYAQYVLVPKVQVLPLDKESKPTELSWEKLAAIPETYLTAWSSMIDAMGVPTDVPLNVPVEEQIDKTILIRGATSSVGRAAMSIASYLDLVILATTRSESKKALLEEAGARHVIIDDGNIQDKVKEIVPEGVHYCLELVGAATLKDSLQCVRRGGAICNTGI